MCQWEWSVRLVHLHTTSHWRRKTKKNLDNAARHYQCTHPWLSFTWAGKDIREAPGIEVLTVCQAITCAADFAPGGRWLIRRENIVMLSSRSINVWSIKWIKDYTPQFLITYSIIKLIIQIFNFLDFQKGIITWRQWDVNCIHITINTK